MTDNEIIKALECHSKNHPKTCEGCPYANTYHDINGECIDVMATDTLDLINRQKAEIEELKEKTEKQRLIIEAIDDNMFPLPFETDYDKAIKNAKAEAIKEFAKRLVAIYENDKTYDRPNAHTLVMTLFRNIDNLVKEMVGEDNA